MRNKSLDPIPKPKAPRRYHGVGSNFVSVREWEQIRFSNEWIRKPLVFDFRAEVISIMSRLREKQRAA